MNPHTHTIYDDSQLLWSATFTVQLLKGSPFLLFSEGAHAHCRFRQGHTGVGSDAQDLTSREPLTFYERVEAMLASAVSRSQRIRSEKKILDLETSMTREEFEPRSGQGAAVWKRQERGPHGEHAETFLRPVEPLELSFRKGRSS